MHGMKASRGSINSTEVSSARGPIASMPNHPTSMADGRKFARINHTFASVMIRLITR